MHALRVVELERQGAVHNSIDLWSPSSGWIVANGRFFYWAYWRGMRPAGPRSRMWILEPDCAYTFPMEDGLTLTPVAPHRDRLPRFQAD